MLAFDTFYDTLSKGSVRESARIDLSLYMALIITLQKIVPAKRPQVGSIADGHQDTHT